MVVKEANLDIIATRRSQYPDNGRPGYLTDIADKP